MLLRQLAQPYIGCMQGASAIVHWVHPWKRFSGILAVPDMSSRSVKPLLRPPHDLAWFIALVVMLLHPCLLIVVINGALMRIVILAYL
ncbi:unnamed protein product [Ectocarpus sp. 12 AP-2014]